MGRLEAKYTFQLSNVVRMSRAEGDFPSARCTIDGLEVDVSVAGATGASINRRGHDPVWDASELIITVAREESEALPDTPKANGGGSDFSTRSRWVDSRRQEFEQAAHKASTRAIEFLRYRLRIPAMIGIAATSEAFDEPDWSYEGVPFRSGTLILHTPMMPDDTSYCEVEFSKGKDSQFEAAMASAHEYELHEVFLADAQTSAVHQEIAHAIMLAAISLEVFTKSRFFGGPGPASLAFDYLTDKEKVKVSVVELIDGVAKAVVGGSFKDDQDEAYQHIVRLFRARNKVAHKGRTEYNDDDGLHVVDEKMLKDWWPSIEKLFVWLDAKIQALPN